MKKDVVILGGGLAGLTLALQLINARERISIVIIEKKEFPYPTFTHSVGESTVELGAYYLNNILGLKDYLNENHLPKNGLRFFFSNEKGNVMNSDILNRVELGNSNFPPAPSYQIERGSFENFLIDRLKKLGVEILDRTEVIDFSVQENIKKLHVNSYHGHKEYKADYFVDASGRFAFIKNKYDLFRKVDHNANAVWFRIRGRLKIDDWGVDSEWDQRINCNKKRWLSTNHLMGKGYWVWIIPLKDQTTSIGLVVDPSVHPFSEIKSRKRTFAWLGRNEPQLYKELKKVNEELLDFNIIRNFSYSCKKLLSDDYLITGEAGMFLDPFYSPGTDFIGLSNTFITDLIISGQNKNQEKKISFYNLYLKKCFQVFLKAYTDKYILMGSPKIMIFKIIWDFSIYWANMCFLFCQRKLTDIIFMRQIGEDLITFDKLQNRMQTAFLSDLNKEMPEPKGWVDLYEMDFILELNSNLNKKFSDSEIKIQLKRNIEILKSIATFYLTLGHGKAKASSKMEEYVFCSLEPILTGD